MCSYKCGTPSSPFCCVKAPVCTTISTVASGAWWFSMAITCRPLASTVSCTTRASIAVAAMLARVVHDTVLANGLQVIAIENHQAPLATVEIVVHTGAFTQQNGEEGVPHLYEHMLFKAYSGPRDYSWGRMMGDLD